MKIKILQLQQIVFWLSVFFIGLFFVSTVVFSTSYYDTYLYADSKLLDFFQNDLQEYNQRIFVFSLVIVVLGVVCWILNPRKYYPTIVTFPIYLIIFTIIIVLCALAWIQTGPIESFYNQFDYSSIQKLAEYRPNPFFPILTKIGCWGCMISGVGSVVVYSVGFGRYLQKRGEADVQTQ